MPGNKDRSRRTQITRESHARTYSDVLNIKIRRDSGMSEPLRNAARDAEKTPNQLMITITKDWLIQNGYMQAPEAPEQEEPNDE